MDSTLWYYQPSSSTPQEHGPVTWGFLKHCAQTGVIAAETMVRPEYSHGWTPARDIRGLLKPARNSRRQLPEADRWTADDAIRIALAMVCAAFGAYLVTDTRSEPSVGPHSAPASGLPSSVPGDPDSAQAIIKQ